MDGVEEYDIRENLADALFSGSPLSPFWFSWRLRCMFFLLDLFTKVDPFNVLEAVATGAVDGRSMMTIPESLSHVRLALQLCFPGLLVFLPIIINVHHFLSTLYGS